MQGSGGAVCTHARCAAQVVGGLTLPGVGSGGGAAVPADVALQAVPGRPVQWPTHPASLRGSAGWCWGSLRACAVRRAGGRGPDAAGGSAAAAPAGDPAVAMLPAMPGRPVQWPTHPASLRGPELTNRHLDRFAAWWHCHHRGRRRCAVANEVQVLCFNLHSAAAALARAACCRCCHGAGALTVAGAGCRCRLPVVVAVPIKVHKALAPAAYGQKRAEATQ